MSLTTHHTTPSAKRLAGNFPEPLEMLPGEMAWILEPNVQLDLLARDLFVTQGQMKRRTRKVLTKLAALERKR